jgi:hypothetical protein
MDREQLLEYADELLSTIVLSGETASFVFCFGKPGRSYYDRVFSDLTEGSSHSIGADRIIQYYLEDMNYSVICRVYPFIMDDIGRSGRTILFYPERLHYPVDSVLRLYFKVQVPLGRIGYATISAADILDYVELKLTSVGRNDLTTIKQSSDEIWYGLSRNPKGAIHVWMQRGPIFRPQKYVTKPSRSGCRLSKSDNVVIGLLSGLFRYGVRYSDFKGKAKLAFVAEVPFISRVFDRMIESGNPAKGT